MYTKGSPMRQARTSHEDACKTTDQAITELVQTLKIVLSRDELCDENMVRRIQSRLRVVCPTHPVVKILTRCINSIVSQRETKEADRSELRALCGDLARNRRFRSTAVALSSILQEDNRRHADAAKVAFEQEIIQLVESGAVVNCGPFRARVISTKVRGRMMKMLVGEPSDPIETKRLVK